MAFHTTSGRHFYLMTCPSKLRGFTFVELMVVMSIVALLLSIAMPRYFAGLQRAKEAVLHEDLATMRDAISHYRGDKGIYPPSLDALIEQKYLRSIPADPITEQADSWIVAQPPDNSPGVYDIHSGATSVATDGSAYNDW